MNHWNIFIQVKEVTEADVLRDRNGYPVKSGIGSFEKTERKIVDRLSFSVSAASEAEAYAKALRILEVNRPESEQIELRSWGSDNSIATGPVPGEEARPL